MNNFFRKSLLTVALAIPAGMAPMTVSAEISGSLEVASQYLWRGQTLSTGALVSGTLDYSHDSGLYAGTWIGTGGATNEYDLYLGFAGEAGDFSYDVGVLQFRYSVGGEARVGGAGNRAKAANAQEAYATLGFADLSLSAFIGVGETGTGEDYEDNYFELGYGYDKFGVTLGMTDLTVSEENYGYVNLGYEVYDGLTFALSSIVWEDTEETYVKEPTLIVSYAFPF